MSDCNGIASQVRHGSISLMNCPHCQRLLYSRLHRKCGYCGEALPEELWLTDEEVAAYRAEKAEIDARRAADKDREEQDREEARKRQASGISPIIPL